MTPRTTRLIRGGLLAGMAVLAAVVTRSLASRSVRPAVDPAPEASESPTTATRMEGFTHFRMEMGETKFSVKAKSYTGKEDEEMHLQGVEVQFTYMARGKEGRSTITADESLYTPTLQKAVFRGNVHVITEDGFELDTQSLVYRGDKNLSRTEDPVRFRRKDLSGTATGAVYDAAARKLELLADVVMKLQDPDNTPMDIKSARAVFEREEGLLRFIDDVEVVQGSDRLTAGRLLVNIAPDTQAIYRAQAVDEVNLWMGGGDLAQGIAVGGSAGRGPRHLTGKKLDLWFRPDRTLQEATAGPDAVLTMRPGKGDPPEKRVLKARFLAFGFDERGKLSELRGQKDSSFVAEPIPPAKGSTRTLNCQSFIARVDPATGEPALIEFTKDVVFTEGTQRATAEKAYLDGAKNALFLQEGPALTDSAQGSRLTAKVIQLATKSGDVEAHDDVRHMLDKPGATGGLLGGKGATLLAADRFEYKSATKIAHYRQSALLRTGKDEIRGDEIRLHELPGGKRRLEAAGSVVSRMHPAAEKDGGKAPATVEARAKEMVYEEGKNEIVYTGDVTIKQGDIQTTSPKATIKLVEGGNSIDTLVAGEPVEVQQGIRRATGARATYTPRTEMMLLVGEKVVLKDPSQELEGRSLTFHVGDARILVDGREQVRTQLIIRDKPKQ